MYGRILMYGWLPFSMFILLLYITITHLNGRGPVVVWGSLSSRLAHSVINGHHNPRINFSLSSLATPSELR